ncbi:iron-containing alcohol dehydrogenase [Christensenellaceae bacterium OttesenSCG-928-L17]|nr:iron-containing alcohol dehydrogenase [Christensenellaceae bacterium OttesenSCG-928-L17]
MQFEYQAVSNLFFGPDCVRQQTNQWILGKRAYIVTGKYSGRMSGAMMEVTAALEENGVTYEVFEGIGNNPSVMQCKEVAALARKMGAEFIIGIGGGSPLDAAKAISVFATHPDLSVDDLFKNAYGDILPIVAVPTTCGTGSEVTPWSVLTRDDLQSKFSFGTKKTVPAAALLNSNYLMSLSDAVLTHTIMDACTHCIESYISVKASPVTEAWSLDGLRRFANCMDAIAEKRWNDVRDELMVISLLGGLAITKTGTTLMHGMGYPLTYYKNMTHGEANCATLPAYLRFVDTFDSKRLGDVLTALRTDIATFSAFVRRVIPCELVLSEEEIRHYAAQTMRQGSIRNVSHTVTQADLEAIYHMDLGAGN